MSDQIIGEVAHFPWVTVRVRTDYDERVVKFLLDTGFDDEIAVPNSFFSWFGNHKRFAPWFLLTGQEKTEAW